MIRNMCSTEINSSPLGFLDAMFYVVAGPWTAKPKGTCMVRLPSYGLTLFLWLSVMLSPTFGRLPGSCRLPSHFAKLVRLHVGVSSGHLFLLNPLSSEHPVACSAENQPCFSRAPVLICLVGSPETMQTKILIF